MKRLLLVVLWLLPVLLGASGVWSAHRARVALRSEHLATLNWQAIADRTERRLTQEKDSLVAVSSRRVEQGRVELRGALAVNGVQARSLTALRVEAESLRRDVTRPVVYVLGNFATLDTLDARDTAGVRVVAEVRVDSASARWRWELERAAAQFDATLGCHGDTAVAQVQGPVWARVTIVRAQQDDRICNPLPPSWRPISLRPPSLVWLGAAGVVGYLLAR